MNCAGSVALCAKAPRLPTSFAAAEGTVAHTLAEALVTGKATYADLCKRIGQIVKQDGHEVEITEEMIDGAQTYVDTIEADRKALLVNLKPAPVVGKAEVRVKAASVDDSLWGTSDYVLYRKGDVLFVDDYKYGKGVIVDPEENEQMCSYAVAVMDGEAGWAFDKVILRIIQPRGAHVDGPVREWATTPAWLREWAKKAKAAVAATRDPKAPRTPGEWCRWCDGKAFCPEMHGTVQEQAKVDFDVVPYAGAPLGLPDVRLMPIEKLALAANWRDAISSWFESVYAALEERLAAGEEIPGWKLVDRTGHRKFKDEMEVVARFGPVVGEDALYERKLLSPAKIEKKVGKGKIDDLVFRPALGKAIARDTDPRPKATSSAQDDFPVAVPPVAPQIGMDDASLMAEFTGQPQKKGPIWPI